MCAGNCCSVNLDLTDTEARLLERREFVHAPRSSRRGGLRVNRVLIDEDILPRRLRPFARP